MEKRDIKNFTLEELKKQMLKIHEQPYKAKQLFLWLYKRGISDFNNMNNIPRALQEELGRNYYIGALELSAHIKSNDGTEKFLFKLSDGNFIETVLIYAGYRKTVCLSTQVGCKFACSFCASGLNGFVRNLTPSEITGQALFLQHNLKYKITNYVFMGMGEPLDNYENVSKAIMIMNEPEAMAIGARRITVSTCGIIPGIEKLKDLRLQVNLSVSLHAADDKLRSELIPINKKYPLKKLIGVCEDYIEKTGRMITLEYVLIKGKNDSAQDVDRLAEIATRLKAKVNLIPCSVVSCLSCRSPAKADMEIFRKSLVERNVNAILRKSKGEDIQAACGQLAGKIRT